MRKIGIPLVESPVTVAAAPAVAFAVAFLAVWPGRCPPIAAAAGERLQRQTTEIKEIQRRFTSPAPPPAARAAAAGPGLRSEDFVRQRRQVLHHITESQIAKMQRLVAVTEEDDPQKPDLYFRLAELRADGERYCFTRARELDQKIFEALPGEKAALQAEQQRWESQRQRWLLAAAQAYVAAVRYRKYERLDEALFKLARLLVSA